MRRISKMRRMLLVMAMLVALFIVAAPAFAIVQPPVHDDCYVFVTIEPIGEWSVECFMSDVVYDECEDFDFPAFLGYIEYCVCANVPWELRASWENASDEFGEEPIFCPVPEDWMVQESGDGIFYFDLLRSEDGEFGFEGPTQLLTSGDCGDFCDFWYFQLVGPDICDEPCFYVIELDINLGAV